MSIATQHPLTAAPTRGWLGRNWKWFLPAVIACAAAATAIAAVSYVEVRLHRYRSHPAYEMALATVQESTKVQEQLGEPIKQSGWFPQWQFDRNGDIIRGLSLNFTVAGPKGSAAVAAQAKLIAGEWAVNGLRVRLPSDEQVNLTQEVLAKQKVDTPAFDPTVQKQTDSTGDDPPPETTDLNVQVPDLPPELKQ